MRDASEYGRLRYWQELLKPEPSATMRAHSRAMYCWSVALAARHVDIESAAQEPASAPPSVAMAAQQAGAFWHALQLNVPASPKMLDPLMPVLVPVVAPEVVPVAPEPVLPVEVPAELPVLPMPVTPVVPPELVPVLPVLLPVLPVLPVVEPQFEELAACARQPRKLLQEPAMHVFSADE